MASLTQWTWVWVNSGSWWWTGRSGMLRFMGSQSRTWLSYWIELNWTFLNFLYIIDIEIPCNKVFCSLVDLLLCGLVLFLFFLAYHYYLFLAPLAGNLVAVIISYLFIYWCFQIRNSKITRHLDSVFCPNFSLLYYSI